jgi:hypothetical protein
MRKGARVHMAGIEPRTAVAALISPGHSYSPKAFMWGGGGLGACVHK